MHMCELIQGLRPSEDDGFLLFYQMPSLRFLSKLWFDDCSFFYFIVGSNPLNLLIVNPTDIFLNFQMNVSVHAYILMLEL